MLIDTSVDGHVHTRLCHHARGTMEEYVQSAVARGLARIIFLEHLEEGISYFETTWLTDRDFDGYFQEGERLQKKYRHRIEIGLGVEVGYNPRCGARIRDRLAAHPWDRIGISYHFLQARGRHLNLVSHQQSNIKALRAAGPEAVISAYLRTLRQAVLELPGTVLCHFDAMLRYVPGVSFTDEHQPLIGELLDAVAAKKMAVEVNTSGYPIRNEPFPSVALLREVVKRSIPLTAGSDAHRPEEVGRYFDELKLLGQALAR
ncbi:MAG: histidinol-phosphatase [Desulfobacterales bacterium]|nr:histidinol-phosphatase [Desulfobacterales bacterium]